LCHHFRRDADPNFFVSTRPGPRSQPKKSAARDLIVRLRKQNQPICVKAKKPRRSSTYTFSCEPGNSRADMGLTVPLVSTVPC
ncbi:MAG: hypothetical protein ACLQU1_13225, partial [Bryobacteraceae bacterium]